jgi:hypothetical protein
MAEILASEVQKALKFSETAKYKGRNKGYE